MVLDLAALGTIVLIWSFGKNVAVVNIFLKSLAGSRETEARMTTGLLQRSDLASNRYAYF